MYYSFVYDFTRADTLSWGLEIQNIVLAKEQKTKFVFAAIAIQFLLWFPIYLWLSQAKLSTFGTAAIMFCGLIVSANIYNAFIEPILVRIYQGKAEHLTTDNFAGEAIISDEGIRMKSRAQDIHYKWDGFHSVHDTENNIIFIGDTLHAVIPSKCFAHFLEKDAFVRECEKRIPAYRADGPEAFD